MTMCSLESQLIEIAILATLFINFFNIKLIRVIESNLNPEMTPMHAALK